jgi:uroporphyrinogen III methyltransferase/synthase
MSKVFLVGAGPGDPELITLKGRRALEQAGVVLYDHLASESLLVFAPPQAERIYVGKKRASHALAQHEICELMIRHARAGRTVVRLKGGDPFIFGRGGEEMEALEAAGIPYEVVPGVTAALGIAAYTGVPLTHRDHTSVVTFVSGHEPARIDWSRVGAAETLVIYMGLSTIGDITRRILDQGRPAGTPALAVRWATRADQHTIRATLADLAARIEREKMRPPATIIIGDVVDLYPRLNWFEKLPLFGTKVVVTRAAEQAGELGAKFHALGSEVIELPCIALRAAADSGPVDTAIAKLEQYDWIVFTSANGVRFFLDRLDASARDVRAIRAHICAIGPGTRRVLEALHVKVDLMPAEYIAESLVKAFAPYDLAGRRILLPRAAVARDLVPVELSKRGAQVDVVEAYRSVVPEDSAALAHRIFGDAKRPDWVTFTSSSTVKNFLALAGKGALDGVRVASIGPVTSETARQHGIEVAAEADPHTIDGLVAAICSHGRGPAT